MVATDLQNQLHAALTRLVNATVAGRRELALHLLAPGAARRLSAGRVARGYRSWGAASPSARGEQVTLTVQPYHREQPQVLALQAGLAGLAPLLHSAYLHGSLGSDEAVAYSDLDALVILPDQVVRDPARLARAAAGLTGLRRVMQDYDPLQHHGWFVLTESDLQQHCQAYFPYQLFAHGRVLWPAAPMTLQLTLRDARSEYRAAFVGLARALQRQLSGPVPPDLYRLKDLLSRLLMLPSLYLQARDGTAVYKKDSFALAAADFPPDLWAVMAEIEALRRDWPPLAAGGWRRWLLTRPVARRRLALALAAPPVPAAYAARFTRAWRARAGQLVATMLARLPA
jgi:hypothetical protein